MQQDDLPERLRAACVALVFVCLLLVIALMSQGRSINALWGELDALRASRSRKRPVVVFVHPGGKDTPPEAA